ncbi:MAG: hypothetical protein JNK25_08175 [Phycisphaerae bacterium]|nr:hypothetical protein [Phycisphaerae bacterium]
MLNLAWCLSGLALASAPVQPPAPPANQPAIRPADPIPFDPNSKPAVSQVPVQVLLGQRMTTLRGVVQLSTVVIVADAQSYLGAISAWKPDKRFPVLIDDGTAESREDIARFVRGYQPAGVVRYSAKPDPSSVGAPSFARIDPENYFAAAKSAWKVPTTGADQKPLLDAWRAAGHRPPGIAVTSESDTSWTASLALAIAWGQPTVFVPAQTGNIDWSMTPNDADALSQRIEIACEDTGFSWRELGDDIEAVTLCLNAPERLSKANNESFALTDRIGRHGVDLNASERWAWAGHIFGSAAKTAYAAQCSIFLQPVSAWLFDGYPDGPPWDGYDATAAGEILKETGMKVEVLDKPNGSAAAWRMRAARPVDAGLVMVNTRGNADFFDLEPGQCRPGDVPMFNVPPVVSMVHSWSLLFPGKRDLLGGRWLERGAFCYAGSVHEPYLHAFVRTPAVAGRFATGAPWGTCVRTDEPKIWKIAVLGDPLYSFSPQVRRVSGALPIEGTTPVGADLRELLTAEKFVEGVREMTLLGRDADVARLAAALVDGKPEKMDSPLAAACILPAFRADNGPLVARLFARLNVDSQKDPILRDALWLSAYPRLEKPDDDALLQLLKNNLRTSDLQRDAALLAASWTVRFGAGAGPGLFAEWRSRYSEAAQRDALDRAARTPWTWGR